MKINFNTCWLALLIIVGAIGCDKHGSVAPHTNYYLNNTQHVSVVTQHNDISRDGLNAHETLLTTSNVNAGQFGKLFSVNVDDEVYAQPLMIGNLTISGSKHNVLYVATVNNTVYAVDGDAGTVYWSNNYTASGQRTPIAGDMNSGWCTPYQDMTKKIGIVGTPVIDTISSTLYFVARSTNGTVFHQHLHAVDITTGSERSGSPVEIGASVPGTGDGASAGMVSFDPRRNNQRMGLLLVNGTVYISFASHCDFNPYHGWIIGYDASTLQQKAVYCNTPKGEGGGIWQSGMGIVADNSGNLYVVSGNGTVGLPTTYTGYGNGTAETTPSPDPTDLSGRAMSAVKLSPFGNSLQVASYFTPYNYVYLNGNDEDYGVIGSFMIPNSSYYFTAAKDGNIYLLDANNMGGFSSSTNNVHQLVPISPYASFHCQPAYYIGSNSEYAYVWSEYDQLRALPFTRSTGRFGTSISNSTVPGPPGSIGAMISVSSNGATAGTGIVWAAYASSGDAGHQSSQGILRAFDATNINRELWNSTMTSGDAFGDFAKFSAPTIANGHVYLATFSGQVVAYGLK